MSSGIFEITHSDAQVITYGSYGAQAGTSPDAAIIPAFLSIGEDVPLLSEVGGYYDGGYQIANGGDGGGIDIELDSCPDGRQRGLSIKLGIEDIPLPIIPLDVPVITKSGKVKVRTLNIAPLVAIMYFAIAGGPEGTETMIQYGGPRLTIVGIIVCSLIWSAPCALMTAELSTRYPENGGFIIWARAAFGKSASFMAGWLQFCFTAADAALYPGLFYSYLTCSMQWSPSQEIEWVVKLGFVSAILLVNLSGASVVGHSSMLLMACIITPFIIAVLIAFSGVFTGTTIVGTSFRPKNWLELADTVDYPAFINVLLWNTGMWESCSVCVGEVQNVPTAFPYALVILVFVVVLNYLIPIMAFTGLSGDYAAFNNGHYITIVRQSMSPLFAYVLGIGQCISSIGLFSSGIFKNAFMICGMSEQGMLPKVFASRSAKTDSPYVSILVTMLVTLPVMSLQTFGAILGVEMVIYCLSLLLEISSLLKLRYISEEDEFDRKATYMIPFSGILFPMVFMPSIAICLYVIVMASETVMKFSFIMVATGIVLIILTRALEQWKPHLFAVAEGVTRHRMKRRRVKPPPALYPEGSMPTIIETASEYGSIDYGSGPAY